MVALPPVKQLALIIHDMLNDGLKPGGKNPGADAKAASPETQQVIANHVRLLDAARKRGLPVFYTGHAMRPDHKDAALGARSRIYGHYTAGTWGAEVIDELKPLADDWIIRKGGGMSAFTGTALDKWLRRLGVTTFVIGGGATAAGVESTVRAARELDFESIVVSDACHGGARANHEASLLNMATFVQVVTTQEVVDALLQAPEPD